MEITDFSTNNTIEKFKFFAYLCMGITNKN